MLPTIKTFYGGEVDVSDKLIEKMFIIIISFLSLKSHKSFRSCNSHLQSRNLLFYSTFFEIGKSTRNFLNNMALGSLGRMRKAGEDVFREDSFFSVVLSTDALQALRYNGHLANAGSELN